MAIQWGSVRSGGAFASAAAVSPNAADPGGLNFGVRQSFGADVGTAGLGVRTSFALTGVMGFVAILVLLWLADKLL